ncbi:YidC/Oxa1 family membrane protein insertase [Veillonella caviae]|uniref:YidC/Oxa1 family membrane protein insertase n=1 Tax=Veillonella caviae TaxID=248316 RepID=UPI000F8D04CE|nr:YidC/Oxa1 family membrane protein insertase [Veillonella caviae]MCF0157602.1 membrane protein insertase YidC [Veillonella sp.]MCI5709291.1 YidC/Oxa1 family membrane protein insertase [Veillonella caviae]MCI6407059.1 YidC/Oxa1 family membrane protein insertase [Veillonella caviae]MCI7692883.1 YidC/Oxa1 family membrane protein insertase [Veillonella caviae]MDD7291588.1 YidC/Oxa1 family membrane protein insertase [Veillonella caviae]
MEFLSSIFNPIVELMRTLLTYAFQLTEMVGFPSYGVAIILLTIVIKAILAPLTVKQIKSMKAMQELQPRMKAIQDKYKNDPQRMQQEIGNMYKEMGVNPLAGCLPLLVQMPFLIAIFYALQNYPYDPNFVQFLWLPSLGETDPYYILPVLSAVSTWLMSRQTSQGATGAAASQQKMMMWFMPLFIGYISLNFPAGLVIYWIVSNVFQFVQQHFIYKGLEANK